uniref:NAD(P)(+)--arginine ADP-ribosyltransferase n=1 Tax=Anoplopoma fimbria TaxID=229290 RepID=C3KH78_ANOFI|nr:Ecto-ADP-ribosyltransferase 5 precursor [Anoplopoma fimbria]
MQWSINLGRALSLYFHWTRLRTLLTTCTMAAMTKWRRWRHNTCRTRGTETAFSKRSGTTQRTSSTKNGKKGLSLGKERVIAIYVYTFISGDMYRPFNEAVRTQGPQYTTTFKYHALHFYLTDVIQKLNALRLSKLVKGEDKCLTVYRRVDEYFSQDVVNKAVRFGSFTSSRYGDYPKERFGDKSCFKIVTCMGADVSKHSGFEIEAEVLIPPYEVFKVTKIKRRSEQPGLQCEVVYTLKSTGPPVSNYNCALFPK